MAEIGNLTQPDSSPDYFIGLLDFLDNHAGISTFRRTHLDELAAGISLFFQTAILFQTAIRDGVTRLFRDCLHANEHLQLLLNSRPLFRLFLG